ncbi:MAG: hypothetical protein IJK96_04975 [Bacteroidales bacterium]|nr:hypothetical protein [Bacteroidales bacterium]
MKKELKLFAILAVSVAVAACSSAEKMAQQAANVKVACNPAVLEAVAGSVDADLTVTYPKDYFHPKAILEVTPVIVYPGGEAKGKVLRYQGENVKDNYKVVPSAGGVVKDRVHFDYVEGMEQSHLELRGVALYKGKTFKLPTRKVADGVNTTYMLVKQDGLVPYKADNYQEVIKQTAEGQILYKVNSSEVQSSQLKSTSINEFLKELDEIRSNDRKTVTGTEVVAYASPEGGEKYNRKLSDNRSKTADKAWKTITKGKDVADPEVRSIGQDWEGFKELVEKSNIQDKDLILRVLSMYSDPAVRESEIKNISEVYSELKSGVLPELRRARFIANVEYQNYTPEELIQLIDDNIDILDEEALLHAAALVNSTDKKIELYKKAAEKYASDRAQFNLGIAYLEKDQVANAEKAFKKVLTKDDELENALGVIALRKGDTQTAEQHFKKAKDAGKANLGVIDILNGDYAKAAQDLADAKGCCHNTVLAYILNDQLDKAQASAKCASPEVAYLKAIIAARKGNASDVATFLKDARKDARLAEREATDIEFADYK